MVRAYPALPRCVNRASGHLLEDFFSLRFVVPSRDVREGNAGLRATGRLDGAPISAVDFLRRSRLVVRRPDAGEATGRTEWSAAEMNEVRRGTRLRQGNGGQRHTVANLRMVCQPKLNS